MYKKRKDYRYLSIYTNMVIYRKLVKVLAQEKRTVREFWESSIKKYIDKRTIPE